MLEEILKQHNVTISVTNEQLLKLANQLLDGAKTIYETKKASEQYLTRKQTAEMLQCDLSTLWRWDKENYLNPIEVGGKRRYKLSEINRILGKEAAL